MKVILELKKGNTRAKRINVRQDIVIGRGSKCSLRVPSSQVSRKHCSITFKDDVVYVTDLGSSNGTWLNGVKLPMNQAFEVGPKMKLALGPVNFVIFVVKDQLPKQDAAKEDKNPEITELSPVSTAPVSAAVADKKNLAPSPLSQASPATDSLDADSLNEDVAAANDSIGRLQPIAKDDANAVENAATDNPISDAGVLQFNESMLVEQDDDDFQLPSIEAFDSEKDIDKVQVIDAFDIVEVVDSPPVAEVAEVADEIEIIEESVALHDVEVIDDIEVLDEIEVIQDIQVLDDIEVLDDVQVLDQVDVLDDFDDIEILDG